MSNRTVLQGQSFFALMFVSTLCFLLLSVINPVSIRGAEKKSEVESERPVDEQGEVMMASSTDIADHIVVSEIYYNSEDESDSEFIEFYNPTSKAIDLSDWSFSDDGGSSWVNLGKDSDSQNNLTIPANGFLLLVDGGWSNNRDDSSWPGGDVVDEMSFTNSGDTVEIRDPDGNVIDSVTYEGDASGGQGVERKASPSSTKNSMRDSGTDADKGNGYDTNSFVDDFVEPLPPEPQNTGSPAESYGGTSNQAPIADAGGPYECKVDQTIQLDGSGSSDPDGTIDSYQWDLDGDGQYDDGSGVKPSFTSGSSGTIQVKLKVTDDGGGTSTAETSVSVTGELQVSVTELSVPADGSTKTTVIAEYNEGATVSLSTQYGKLAQNSVSIGKDGTAEVDLTAPSNSGPSTIKATADDQVAAATVFFQEEGDLTPINSAKTGLIGSGNENGVVDGRVEVGAVVRATKRDDSIDKDVTLTVAGYSENPTEKQPLESPDGFIDVYVDQPASLEQLTLEVYLDQWPEEPKVKYWNSSDAKWALCSDTKENSTGGYVEVGINSSSSPSLEKLSGLPFVAGGKAGTSKEMVSREVKVTQPGWNMVSIPVEPKDSSPAAIFQGVGPSKIVRWNAGGSGGKGGYISSDEGFSVKPCRGNWVYLTGPEVPKTFKVTGKFDDNREITMAEKGWHQLGVPVEISIDSIGVREKEGGRVVSVTRAAEKGWLSRFLWQWDPVEGIYYAYEFGKNQKSARTGKSYWIRTDQQDIRLIIPYPSPPAPPSSSVTSNHPVGVPLTGNTPEKEDIPSPPAPPAIQPITGLSVMASPNPVTAEELVTFQVKSPEVKSLQVITYDAAGNRVYSSNMRSGDTLQWNLSAQEGVALANGIYLYQVRAVSTANRIMLKVGKLLVLR